MNEYRKVDSMFSGLDSHIVASKSLIERPYKDNDEDVLIEGQILETLEDGIEIELCLTWFWLRYLRNAILTPLRTKPIRNAPNSVHYI